MKENVNKITDRKINKNIKFNNNISSQNQWETDNHDLHCKRYDHENHENCDCEFCKDESIQNFSTKSKTNNEKK